MKIDGWNYYVYAAIPSTPPHIETRIAPIENGDIWKLDGKPILARWTSNWDCDHETNWWYCIKDTPFDLNDVKSKRRYEIKKGTKNFDIREINPRDFKEDLYRITIAAYATYPKSYRPKIEYNSFCTDLDRWQGYRVFGAFEIGSNQLCGYACLVQDGNYIDFRNLKVFPNKERLAINAAIIYKILIEHRDFLSSGGYICDGARSIQHETAFQEYLEKYFGFRKAYCYLHIAYKPNMIIVINIMYRLRKVLLRLNGISMIRKANALIRMEEINRENLD